MDRCSYVVALLAILLSAANSGGAVLYDNGPPSLTGGSEMSGWVDANQLTLTTDLIVENIKFWDVEAASASFQSSILWQIYSNTTNNTPGPLLFSGTSTNLSHVATGNAAFGVYPEFLDSFDVPAVALPAGTYWIALHNGPLSINTNQHVFWESAITANTTSSLSDIAPFMGNWQSNGAGSQLAFQLIGVPESFRPKIVNFAFSSGALKISFTTVTGQNYRVEYKNNLLDSGWTVVTGADSIPGTGGAVQISDPDPNIAKVPHRFYRVTLL